MPNRRPFWCAAAIALFVVAVCLEGDGFPTLSTSFTPRIQETNPIISQGYASEINLARAEAKRIISDGRPAPGNSQTAERTGRVRPPGVSIAVAIDGEMVWAEGFGLADNLASAVVEGASGRDFLSFMRDEIFTPLGMQDSTADENERIIPHRGRCYQINLDGSYRNSPYADLSYKWGSGGFLSSSQDLVKFGSAFLKSGFVNKDSLDLMFVPKDLIQEGLGVGWSVYKEGERAPERIYISDGSSVGGSSALVIYPDQKVVISWVMNTDDFVPLNDKDLRRVALPFLERQNLLHNRGP